MLLLFVVFLLLLFDFFVFVCLIAVVCVFCVLFAQGKNVVDLEEKVQKRLEGEHNIKNTNKKKKCKNVCQGRVHCHR